MGKKIKHPITRGVARVPVVMQLEALECGAACLSMILAYYDKWVPLEQVRANCGVSRDGSNAKNVLKAARYYGLTAQGYRYEIEDLKKKGTFPCIIHWNFNHFVVLDGFRAGKAYLNDPARGSYSVPMKEFDVSYTGICLAFEPSENFTPSGSKKSMLRYASKRLKGFGAAIAFAMITGVITAIAGIMSSAFSRVFLDRLLTGRNPEWLRNFLVLLGLFNVTMLITKSIQAIYNLRINGKLAAVGNTTYMWKVLHLPMSFFSQRLAGDIQGRQSTNASIANTLIGTFAPMLINVVMTVFYLVVMIRYSVLLTAVGIISLIINSVVSNLISRKRVNITRVSMRDEAMLSSATVAGIEMIETIKAAGAENGYFAKWAGYQANINTQKINLLKVNSYLGMIPQFVSMLANNAVLLLGVLLTMRGQFTVGMVMAFQGFLSSFMAPVQDFISAGQTIQEIRTKMERVEDVMEYPSDDVFAEDSDDDTQKLSGNIELNNITFGYSPLGEPLINDFNLKLYPGKTVAIVGGSGCGKSTMSKLISGMYQPWSGEILFDGKPMKEISRSVFYSSLAVVDQDIILFEDTVSNNIKMWDESIDDSKVVQAARDVQLHHDIMQRPLGYQHKIAEGGKDFSGGQRQRLEIARVLAQDPTIIILDEATSALDSRTEYEVVKAICNRGITCVVIAHRLSTIRSADEIIVMDKGVIIDRGTHDELMQNSKLYQELVISE